MTHDKHTDSDSDSTANTNINTDSDSDSHSFGFGLDRRTALKAFGAAGLAGVLTGPASAATDTDSSAGTASHRVGELDRTATLETSRREWHTVSFAENIDDPVVVMGPLSYAGAHPAHPRLRNLDGAGYEWRLEEWSYLGIGGHAAEDVSYMALEAGVHEIDGRTVEAGTVDADHFWQDVAFTAGFDDAPLLFTTPQTTNGGDPIVSRTKDVTAAGFTIQAREEQSGLGHAIERMGFIAIEDAASTPAARFDAGTTTTDHEWASVGERVSDASAFVASVATNNGGDPCNARYRRDDAESVSVRVQEERSVDPETYHAEEQVVYLAGDVGSIVAANADGTGDAPAPPTLSITDVTQTSITVDPSVVENSDYYTVYLTDGNGTDRSTQTDGHAVTVDDLASDTEYQLSATVTGDNGETSARSDSVSARTESSGDGDGERLPPRIGYSADGNIRDYDDTHASPLALLQLSTSGEQDRLTHFDKSNILGSNDDDLDAEHNRSIATARDLLGYTDGSVFFDDHDDLDGAVSSIASEINKSTESDRFYLLVAGRMEVPWRGINAADAEKRQHCTVVSHSNANDRYTDPPEMTHTWADIGADFECDRVHIRDQNGTAFKSPPDEWEWLKQLRNGETWYDLVATGEKAGDASDAGMMHWLLTDHQTADMSEIKSFFQPYSEHGGESDDSDSDSESGPGSSGPVFGADLDIDPPEYPHLSTYEGWLGRTVRITDAFVGHNGRYEYTDGPDWLLDDEEAFAALGDDRRVCWDFKLKHYDLEGGANGAYNDDFRQFGEILVNRGMADSYIRPAAEFDLGHTINPETDEEAAQFGDFFAEISETMYGVDGGDFKMVWNPANTMDWRPDAYVEGCWPGNEYVDYVGLDLYDRTWDGPYDDEPITQQDHEDAWDLHAQPLLDWLTEFAASHGDLPVVIPEWGCWTRANSDKAGDDNPYFVEQMYDWMHDPANDVAWQVYFEVLHKHELQAGETAMPNASAKFEELFGG